MNRGDFILIYFFLPSSNRFSVGSFTRLDFNCFRLSSLSVRHCWAQFYQFFTRQIWPSLDFYFIHFVSAVACRWIALLFGSIFFFRWYLGHTTMIEIQCNRQMPRAKELTDKEENAKNSRQKLTSFFFSIEFCSASRGMWTRNQIARKINFKSRTQTEIDQSTIECTVEWVCFEGMCMCVWACRARILLNRQGFHCSADIEWQNILF